MNVDHLRHHTFERAHGVDFATPVAYGECESPDPEEFLIHQRPVGGKAIFSSVIDSSTGERR